MNTAVAVIDLSTFRTSEAIRKGQRAWSAIKGTAAEQRFWWLDVGTALIEGKDKANRKAGQKFSEWVQEMFPEMSDKAASDAMWFATNSGSLPKIPAAMSSPEWIRKWFNEQQATAALPADAPEVISVTAPASQTRLKFKAALKNPPLGRLRIAEILPEGCTSVDVRRYPRAPLSASEVKQGAPLGAPSARSCPESRQRQAHSSVQRLVHSAGRLTLDHRRRTPSRRSTSCRLWPTRGRFSVARQ